MTEEERAKSIIDHYNALQASRSTWISHWRDICKYVLPRKTDLFSDARTPGSKKMSGVYDCEAIMDNDIFAAGMYGHLCPPNQRWFMLGPGSSPEGIPEDHRHWYQETTRVLHEELGVSNFALVMPENFRNMGSVGTSDIYVEKGDPGMPTLVFKDIFLSDFCVEENAKGMVDKLYRRLSFKPNQAIKEFGEENVTQNIRDAAEDDKKRLDDFHFIHATFPRDERDEDKLDNANMPYASLYVDEKNKKIVSESGYHEFPHIVGMLDKETGESYGRSPGMKMLPEIKLLNKMVKTTIVAAEKIVDPALQAPHDGFLYPFRTAPGKINYYRAGTTDRIEPLETKGNVNLGLEMEDRRRANLQRAWFVDLFLMLAEKKNMTATEVLERVEEKLIILGPILGRMFVMFNHLIDRCLGILFRAGKLPPVPDGLHMYEVQYVSKLALAMKLLEVKAFNETMGYIAPIVEGMPHVMDNYDEDKIVRGISERSGMPTEWMRDTDEVTMIRTQRREANEKRDALAAAAAAAEAVPKVSKKIEKGSPLEALAGMMQ